MILNPEISKFGYTNHMQRIITTTYLVITALIPLIFSHLSSELFEFPKFIVLLAATIIITASWIAHFVQHRDWNFFPIHSPRHRLLVYSILAVLLTQILATIFSIHPYTSFWGYYSRFHQGLLTTICYTILFFAGIKWLDNKSTQKLIKLSINTSLIISLIAILEHFNVSLTCLFMTALDSLTGSSSSLIFSTDCWGGLTNPLNRSFATLGQPNWLAAYLLPNLFLLLASARRRFSPTTLLSFAILVTALIFTDSRSGLLALGLALPTYWGLSLRSQKIKQIIQPATISITSVIALALLFGTALSPSASKLLTRESIPSTSSSPTTPQAGTALETGGTESGEIRQIVWTGASRLIQHHALLGTGPETFAYTYYWERPLLHNYTSEWDYLYNKAHNEYLNLAATTGILGLLAFLAWHFSLFNLSFLRPPPSKKINREKDHDLLAFLPVAGAGVVAYSVTNFFGFSVIPTYFMMVLLSVIPFSLLNDHDNDKPSSLTAHYLVGLSTLILLVLFPLRLYLADYYYNLGKNTPSLDLLRRAIALRPTEDLYHTTLAENYASVGAIELAIQEAQFSLAHNPFHLNYYKSRAKVYITLATNNPEYYAPAASELVRARQLAPTDPKLAYNLGLVNSRLGDIEGAESQIRQAIDLKKDYADAYYALTLIYEQTEQTEKIPELLRTAQSNLATYSGLLQEKFTQYLDN